jgi:hypothetical protein
MRGRGAGLSQYAANSPRPAIRGVSTRGERAVGQCPDYRSQQPGVFERQVTLVDAQHRDGAQALNVGAKFRLCRAPILHPFGGANAVGLAQGHLLTKEEAFFEQRIITHLFNTLLVFNRLRGTSAEVLLLVKRAP